MKKIDKICRSIENHQLRRSRLLYSKTALEDVENIFEKCKSLSDLPIISKWDTIRPVEIEKITPGRITFVRPDERIPKI